MKTNEQQTNKRITIALGYRFWFTEKAKIKCLSVRVSDVKTLRENGYTIFCSGGTWTTKQMSQEPYKLMKARLWAIGRILENLYGGIEIEGFYMEAKFLEFMPNACIKIKFGCEEVFLYLGGLTHLSAKDKYNLPWFFIVGNRMHKLAKEQFELYLNERIKKVNIDNKSLNRKEVVAKQ